MAGKGGPKGNQFAKGNKGGGRLGYTYERDQLVQLRNLTNRLIAMADSIVRGKFKTDEDLARAIKKFQILQPTFNKALDKLQPNKSEIDHKNLPKQLPTPILALIKDVHIHHGHQENKRIAEADTGDSGGDVSQ